MLLREFIWQLFEANHRCRRTDASLETLIRIRFPDSSLDVPIGNHKTRLRFWRSEYNCGKMWKPPNQMSFRYNRKGVACTGREKALSVRQIEERLKTFRFSKERNGFDTDSIVG